MNQERMTLYAAALFLETGKFALRAEEAISKEFQNMATKTNGFLHTVYSLQFITQYKEKFKLAGIQFELLYKIIEQHENPNTTEPLAKLLSLALTAATGRPKNHSVWSAEKAAQKKQSEYKQTVLRPVLESVKTRPNAEVTDHEYYLPAEPLTLSEVMFPKPFTAGKEAVSENTRKVKELYRKFKSDLDQIPTNSSKTFDYCETLLQVMHVYLSRIPAFASMFPDLSLYDHIKSVGSFVICLYDYWIAQEKNMAAITQDANCILFVGGDLSGIQSYLYDIIGKQAANNLKGRSFYLQLLTDSVMNTLLSEFSLSSANIIYASGGGFYLLAANTEENQEILKKTANTIYQKLYEAHETTLFLAIDSVSFPLADLINEEKKLNKITDNWKALAEKINLRKRKRYLNQILKDYKKEDNVKKRFFDPKKIDGNEKIDVITNQILTKGTEQPLEKSAKDKTESANYVSALTNKQILLGKRINEANAIVLTKEAENADKNKFVIHPAGLNMGFSVKSKYSAEITGEKIRFFNEPTEFLKLAKKLSGFTNAGFDFYGGNTYPTDGNDNEPLSFNDLAGGENERFRRLGVLRMDVDNLGQIFIHGFKQENKTFSRLSALSRNLDFFFKGFLNTLHKEKYKNTCYIIYAGGDDLFIVGKWDKVIEFARDIQQKFKEYCCNNNHITISGGISVVTDKFPIMKAADLAGEAEEHAKKHVSFINQTETDKNAINVFGMSLGWGFEYKVVTDLKNKIVLYIKEEYLKKSFLQKMKTFATMRQKQEANQQNPTWHWLLAYDLHRNTDKNVPEEVKTFLNDLQKSIHTNQWEGKSNANRTNYHTLDLVQIACRWAEFITRQN